MNLRGDIREHMHSVVRVSDIDSLLSSLFLYKNSSLGTILLVLITKGVYDPCLGRKLSSNGHTTNICGGIQGRRKCLLRSYPECFPLCNDFFSYCHSCQQSCLLWMQCMENALDEVSRPCTRILFTLLHILVELTHLFIKKSSPLVSYFILHYVLYPSLECRRDPYH